MMTIERKQVYHFTDTLRLPWILQSGALKPGRNNIAGFPVPDFLWATTDARGDRSATSAIGGSDDAYRAGVTRQVRFTLHGEDFQKWPDITRDYPAWTSEQVARLELAAKSSPAAWRCRAEPLSEARWLGIETRSYFAPTWKPLQNRKVFSLSNDTLGIMIEDKLYCSRECKDEAGNPTGYIIIPANAALLETAKKVDEPLRNYYFREAA
jgi:hypothetical protein